MNEMAKDILYSVCDGVMLSAKPNDKTWLHFKSES